MNIKIVILIILANSFNLNAQKYTSLEFENYNPLWSRTSLSEKIPVKVQWYWLEQNQGNAILTIKDNIMYNIYNIFNYWVNGFYIEAVNLNNGNLIWDYSYYGNVQTKRRYAQHPEFKGDSMHIMIYEENDSSENPIYPIWASAHPGKIILNKNNGLILDSTFQTNRDPQEKILVLPFTPFSNNFSTHLYSYVSGYKYIKNTGLINSTTGENFLNYERYLLDEDGKQMDSITFRVTTKYKVINNSIVDVEDKKLFCSYYTEDIIDSTKKTELSFHFMNEDFIIFDSGKIDLTFLNEKNYKSVIHRATSKYIIVRSDSTINQSEAYLNYLTLFDSKGNITENLDLRNLKLTTNNADFIGAEVIHENSVFKILFCVNSAVSNTLTFYKSDGLGHFNEVGNIKIKADTKQNIVLRRIQVVGDNLLCLFSYYDTMTKVEPLPLWNAWVMIDGKDLGIMTQINNEGSSQEYKLKILPNPTSDILKVEFERIISGDLHIYNEIGHLIKSVDLYNVKVYEFNASDLVEGKYYIQFIDEDKVFNSHFIKVK